jgi:carboxyl-terminal processing protease
MSRYQPPLFCFFIFVSAIAQAQQSQDFQKELTLLKNVILSNHFSPRPIDDAFSVLVYENVLDRLDPHKLYFTQEDLSFLSTYRNSIDDDVNDNTLTFFEVISKLYKASLQRTVLVIEQATERRVYFNQNENLVKDTLWTANAAMHIERWRQKLKYEELVGLFRIYKDVKNMPDDDFISKYELEARQKVKRNQLRPIKRMLNYNGGFEQYVFEVFLRSITTTFDPHSLYFSPLEMENFLASLSTKGYSFGFTIDENEYGNVVITQLLPGGPAWKSGEVHTGDVIRQLRWEETDPIDVTSIDLDEIEAIFNDVDHSTLELTLADVSGLQKQVKLKKEKIDDEENIVKSFILEGIRKVGYISLPGFYSNWSDESSSNCANDVAKEILKLKKENVEGIILDVRFNGGGSLHEAVAMAGIFIDAGPVGVLKDKNGQLLIKKDMNRGTVYDGPLVLMVNGMSASASEILAAALQDYNRAVIVGEQTFGKGTAQKILALDPQHKIDLAQGKASAGFATITTGKIYRVMGKTTQRHGVTPDIQIPDLLNQFKIREEKMPLALPSDYITKKVYYQSYDALPLKELKAKSENRINNDTEFKLIRDYSSWLSSFSKGDPISLKWTDFKNQYQEQQNKITKLTTAFTKETSLYRIKNHAFEEKRTQMDAYVNNMSKAWFKKLMQDVSLEEGYNIICELITTEDHN